MAEDGEIDIEGDFEFKLESNSDVYDTNELPSKSANLLPEYTNPAWVLEQGWTMDSFIDEKSKATIEKMLQEEQYYINGKGGSRFCKSPRSTRSKPQSHKRPWNEDERRIFEKGLEIYGRSWSKIAELIPSRTALQVKNYAQQYFKMKAKKGNTVIEVQNTQVSQSEKTENPLSEALASVTTAQPTVSSVFPTQNIPATQSSQSVLLAHLTMSQHKGIVSSTSKPGITNDSRRILQQDIIVSKESESKKKFHSLLQRQNESKPATVSKPSIPDVPLSTSANKTTTKVKKEAKTVKQKSEKNVVHSQKSVPEESVSMKVLQLSPTLEDKLASSTGIIENLDGFCAVADIVTGTEKDGDDDEEIDIENDEDNEENPILKSRSASPNSVYEKLLKSANMNRRIIENKNKVEVKENPQTGHKIGDNKTAESTKVTSLDSDDGSHPKDQSDIPNEKDDKTAEDTESKTSEDCSGSDMKTELMLMTEKKISNSVVLYNGDIVEFEIPTEELHMDFSTITEQERTIHSEFFDGRASKTPERYLKIRNYILQSWRKSKPNYLNKTSVRPGLKNCGDVNCIGRIHTYLECTGAINFGCDQACYRQPAKTGHVSTKEKVVRDIIAQLPSNINLEFMRSRKRRIRDEDGQWVNEIDLQGKTIEHSDILKDEGTPSKNKSFKSSKTYYDPFKLIPCQPFTEEIKPPFAVEILNVAIITMDLHAHISKTEVIGMLGGHYYDDIGVLEITMAVPCNSISTGMQCEIDPVSQTNASEEIRDRGYSLIGWYHSHPTFSPNPSVRDIETQLKFQDWFSKGGCTFVGVIVSPYNRLNSTGSSEFQCLTISQEHSEINKCNIPYFFDYKTVIKKIDTDELINTTQMLADKYCQYSNRVELLGIYKMSSATTCLDKMMSSITESLQGDCPETEVILEKIRTIFTEAFIINHADIIDPDFIDNNESASQMDTDGETMYIKTDIDDFEVKPNQVVADTDNCVLQVVPTTASKVSVHDSKSVAEEADVSVPSALSIETTTYVSGTTTDTGVVSSSKTEAGSRIITDKHESATESRYDGADKTGTGSRITESKSTIKTMSSMSLETKILQNGIEKTIIHKTA